jgi:hypothetical protein
LNESITETTYNSDTLGGGVPGGRDKLVGLAQTDAVVDGRQEVGLGSFKLLRIDGVRHESHHDLCRPNLLLHLDEDVDADGLGQDLGTRTLRGVGGRGQGCALTGHGAGNGTRGGGWRSGRGVSRGGVCGHGRGHRHGSGSGNRGAGRCRVGGGDGEEANEGSEDLHDDGD